MNRCWVLGFGCWLKDKLHLTSTQNLTPNTLTIMLSRVADSLYWTSRYLERAEHTARLIDIGLNLMLDQSSAAAERRWGRLLDSLHAPPLLTGSSDAYH